MWGSWAVDVASYVAKLYQRDQILTKCSYFEHNNLLHLLVVYISYLLAQLHCHIIRKDTVRNSCGGFNNLAGGFEDGERKFESFIFMAQTAYSYKTKW